MTTAPIALFVYNRLSHAMQTVEALKKNELAEESDLYIFSDAPKKSNAVSAVSEVRDYIRGIIGFKSISIIEREENLGLSKSIIDGVGKLCDEFGQVIVLEDDILTSPYFLRYMNEALDLYRHEENVISIHGYVFPVNESLPNTFFLRGADCWGWATWKRGWVLFKPDALELLESLKKNHLEKMFNFDGSYDYIGLLRSQVRGKNDSWAIRWYASAFLENKLTLYPGSSLVLNIGIDGSGTHLEATDIFSGKIAGHPVVVGEIPITENHLARTAVSRFLGSHKKPVVLRVIKKAGNIIKRCLR
jgi:hypothetical protein